MESFMISARVLVLFFLLGFASLSFAQTACPQGVAPGSPQCGPSGGSMQGSGATVQPSRTTAHWELTWGGFASDDTIGVTGTSTGQRSKRAARQAAMARCASLGGKTCEVVLVYQNQCAVAAHPVNSSNQPEAGVTVYQAGPTIEVASDLALKGCDEKNKMKTCKILYSNCTKPYLVYD